MYIFVIRQENQIISLLCEIADEMKMVLVKRTRQLDSFQFCLVYICLELLLTITKRQVPKKITQLAVETEIVVCQFQMFGNVSEEISTIPCTLNIASGIGRIK